MNSIGFNFVNVKASMKKRFRSLGDREDPDESDRENVMDEDEDESVFRVIIGNAFPVFFPDLNLPLLQAIGIQKLCFTILGFKLRGE